MWFAFMIYCNVSVTYVQVHHEDLYGGCEHVTGFYLWSGMMSFCVWMVCSVVYAECHMCKVNGYNCLYVEFEHVVSYFCDDGDYPYVMI